MELYYLVFLYNIGRLHMEFIILFSFFLIHFGSFKLFTMSFMMLRIQSELYILSDYHSRKSSFLYVCFHRIFFHSFILSLSFLFFLPLCFSISLSLSFFLVFSNYSQCL